MNELIKELEKWSQKYDISFQFWGEYFNSVTIEKDDVELFDRCNLDTVEDTFKAALEWVYRVNRTPKNERVV